VGLGDAADGHDKDERRDQAIVQAEHDLAQPVAAMGMLLVDVVHVVS